MGLFVGMPLITFIECFVSDNCCYLLFTVVCVFFGVGVCACVWVCVRVHMHPYKRERERENYTMALFPVHKSMNLPWEILCL